MWHAIAPPPGARYTAAVSRIEDLILEQDRRGISALRPFLPPDYCRLAARFIQDHPGPAIITTGFYIRTAGVAETDGPPGAIAIGRALQSQGRQVTYVSDRYGVPHLSPEQTRGAKVVDFPIAGAEESRAYADKLLAEFQPGLVISIERCGASRDGLYRNMRSLDITEQTARVDFLFKDALATIGIGDGGNEIGMGNVYDEVVRVPSLVPDPAATRVSRLLIASVSNWGGYGLASALSLLAKRDLLLTAEEEAVIVQAMVARGAVDGISGENKPYVDGFPPEVSGKLIDGLHTLISDGLR
ncbi:MAG: DUF4392 domain-containing protein [Chloroflexota bacterium]|nr:DUF4392 domain-containing protein [Chloroflexota bacterium]